MAQGGHEILVGVTGPGENTAALRWAAERAAHSSAPVRLVHAIGHLLPPPPPSVLIAAEPVKDAGRRLLADCAAEFREVAGEGARCTGVLEAGHPSRVLVDLSTGADVVVVAHRAHARRIVTGSTSVAVATHAHCPVVAVPKDWSARTSEEGWVTVGVHELGSPAAVLDAAFEAAVQYGAPLRLVHAWHLDSVYDDIIVGRIEPDWQQRLEHELREALAPLRARHPEVRTEVVVLHEWPADALARLAVTSSLLVVGRHGHHAPLPQRIGSIARTAIRTSACPVMVVPV